MAELWPFGGLPAGWEAYFALALCVIVAMFAWSLLLFIRGQRAMRRAPEASRGDTDAFSWVFLVPALNEEVTIADSVERLLALELAERRVVVIDDGSDDRTAEILAEIDHPDLTTIRRREPDARKGKAAALDHACRTLEGIEEGRERVIVAIVDADGRLHPEAPAYAATHFADPEVGGVQSLVRIYNRHRLLTWLQDVEFSVYGYLFQAGRNGWGTAGMGGNGQFNRLSALDEVADARGPWRDRLTEDQDLGLRLIEAGWKGRQELRGAVDQQGLSNLSALFRQRTRWSQGNLQAMALARRLLGTRGLGLGPRIELLAYLLMPLWQGIIGVALIAAVVFAITGVAPFWAGGPTWMLVAFYLFAFGGTVLGAIASRTRDGLRGYLVGFLIGHVYAIYTWMIWPVLIRSTLRQLGSRDGWAKTEREPLGEGEISVA
ncbi:MAG: glycosyltransferase family 2 protein [Solirubrobacterales bacterium]